MERRDTALIQGFIWRLVFVLFVKYLQIACDLNYECSAMFKQTSASRLLPVIFLLTVRYLEFIIQGGKLVT